MIRIVSLLVFFLAAQAQAETREAALARLTEAADSIAAVEPGSVPLMLLKAVIAANQSDHLTREPARSALTRSLVGQWLTKTPTQQLRAELDMLSALVGERISPRRVAEIHSATVFYGRNCRGFAEAAEGIADVPVGEASDAVWLALAALPRAPSVYLGNRGALKDRVRYIIDEMKHARLVDAKEAERLSDLPVANLDRGPGCFG